jgi:hypothetical protein
MSPQPAIVCDVDGTVCDVRTIRYLVDGTLKTRDFAAFHDQSLGCPANLAVKRILELSGGLGFAILMITGRQERWSFLTALWMKEHNIHYDELYMRRNSDARPDAQVKAGILKSLSGRYSVSLAIDDNPSTVPVWINASIPTVTIGSEGDLLGLSSNSPDSGHSPLLSLLRAEFAVLA